MAKYVPTEIQSGYLSTEALNEEFQKVATAIDDTVSRSGQTPNSLTADVDFDGNRILNLPDAAGDGEPVTLRQLASFSTGYVVQRQESYDADGGETVINFTALRYTPGSNNLGVYKNGVRLFAGHDFSETSESSITLVTPLLGTDVIVSVTNEFFGSLEPPQISFVPWSAIVGAPETATRDPTYAEVTGKPSTFPPDVHTHDAGSITSGRLADARRGVFVQAGTPTATAVGDLWFY